MNCKMTLWRWALVLVLALLFSAAGCATIKLERQLDTSVRDWYEQHVMLMDTKVPWWIDENEPSERVYFLRLSKELQKQYIKVFWQIRQEGADEIFYSRLDFVNETFDDEGIPGWKTDRGQIVLLCGLPDIVQYYYHDEVSLPSEGMLNGDYRMVWLYYVGRIPATYVFCYSPPQSWDKCIDSVASLSNQASLEKSWRDIFKPTESGWDAWLSVILQ